MLIKAYWYYPRDLSMYILSVIHHFLYVKISLAGCNTTSNIKTYPRRHNHTLSLYHTSNREGVTKMIIRH